MKKFFLVLISLILLSFYASAEDAADNGAKAEPKQQEAAKTDEAAQPAVTTQKGEPPKAEAPKAESAEKAEAAKTEAAEKAEAPKAESEKKAGPEKGKVYAGMPITPEFSKEVIDKITAKYSKMYETYAGVKNKRYVTVEYRDPKTDKLLETEKYVYTRWDYWYKDLKYELHSCESDGKPRKPGIIACDPHESEPGIPHFDKNGEKEYIRELVAVEKLKGRLAYKIKMTARKPKKEHFVGHVWVSVDKLEYMQNEGKAGKKRMGEKELYVKYQAKDFNNGQFFHFVSGYTRVTISVMGYKRVMVYRFENKEIELMPKKGKK